MQPSTLNSDGLTGAAPSVLQCGLCHRQHDGAGGLLPSRLCVPSIVECGREDCAAVMEQILADQRAYLLRVKARQRDVGSKRKAGKAVRGASRPATFRSSCAPAEARNPLPVEREVEADLPHKERQAAFVAEGKGENDNEKMLELLFVGFNPADGSRRSRGRWIAADDLIHKEFINTPHSRASELRGSKTHVAHALVSRWRLEIDQCSDGAVTGHVAGASCYSVCFLEHSKRLERERAKAVNS